MIDSRQDTDGQDLIERVLTQGRELHLAMSDGDYPYLVPLNYGYVPGRIYIHSGRQGKKLDCLRRDPRVCFAVNAVVERIGGEKACQWSTRFRSVTGYGVARIIDEPEEKIHGYDVIMAQFGGPVGNYDEQYLKESLMICIEIERLTGRQSSV